MSRQMMAIFVAVAVGVLQPAFGPVLHAQGPREGIKVHGHWVIDVRQPNGTLVSHTEFENALMNMGTSLLVHLLSRSTTMGRWHVELPNGPCGPPSPFSSTTCYLSEPPALVPASGDVGSLQVSTDYLQDWVLVLSGSFTATRTGAIARVITATRVCGSGVAAANCEGNSAGHFSGTNLTPVSVTSGQIVQIKVTLSFS